MLPSPLTKQTPSAVAKYPSRIQKGLWLAFNGSEPMTNPPAVTKAKKIHYLDDCGGLRPILVMEPYFFTETPPVVVLLGPLLHPEMCELHTLPWVQHIRSIGKTVYFITHRGHNFKTNHSPTQYFSNDFEDIAFSDVSSALHAILEHGKHQSFELFGAGLGSILAVLWLIQNGTSSLSTLHLCPPTHTVLPKNRYKLACKLGTRISIQTLWNYHLGLGILDDWLSTFTLRERSYLLHSNSWIDMDWVSTLLNWSESKVPRLSQGGLLKNALPPLDDSSIHIYTPELLTYSHWLMEPFLEYSPSILMVANKNFPVLDVEFTLSL